MQYKTFSVENAKHFDFRSGETNVLPSHKSKFDVFYSKIKKIDVNQKFPSLKGGCRVQMPNVYLACPLESTGATHLKRSQMTVM